MKKYHKIQTVFLRDPETKYRTLLEGQFARPEFEYLKDSEWVFTEKVDGTNIRIEWLALPSHNNIHYGGRTDNASMATSLVNKLQVIFSVDKFKDLFPHSPMTLYGEGYGAKIKKGGGNYIPGGVDFILFDVRIGDIWLEWHNVLDIADKLGINIVPIVATGTLIDAIDMVKHGFKSTLRETPPEGLVMRPKVGLQDRRGNRIITKLKMKDFSNQ